MHLAILVHLALSPMAIVRPDGAAQGQAKATGLLPVLLGLLVMTRVIELEEMISDEL